MLGVLVEPMLLLGLWVAAQVAGSTNISNITDTVYHWPLSQSIPLVLALCACAFATFIEMGKLPFDLAEAEQELQEGPLSEVGVLVIALFENSMARLRLDITPRITWAGFGFAFLAFVSLLAA